MGITKRKSAEKLKEPRHVKCPYLVNRSRKVCRRMAEEGLDGELPSSMWNIIVTET